MPFDLCSRFMQEEMNRVTEICLELSGKDIRN